MGEVTFNEEVLLAKFLKSETVQRKASALVNEKVQKAKQELIQEFNESEVTQEIEAGPDVSDSKVLPGGYGNLFSFLGFREGREPIPPLREELEKISVNRKPEITSRKWIFKIRAPSEDDIERVTPMDWESGRSWVNAVTKGLSGFSYFLNKLSKAIGRSGGGIQTKTPVRSGGQFFRGTPYIIGMLGRFKRKINS